MDMTTDTLRVARLADELTLGDARLAFLTVRTAQLRGQEIAGALLTPAMCEVRRRVARHEISESDARMAKATVDRLFSELELGS